MLIKILLTKHKKLLASFFVLFLALISLGIWQLLRLEEKNHYIESVFKSLNEPAKLFTNDKSLEIYEKITIDGKIDSDKFLWLYRRHPLVKYEDGAYLIVPLETNSGQKFLAIVGWVKKDLQKDILKEISSNNNIKIEGIVMPGERNSIFIPANDFSKKMIFTLDMQELSKNLNIDANNYFIASLMNEPKFETQIIPITSDMMIKIKNDHMEYAVTWFSLAIGLAFIFYFYSLKLLKSE